MSENDSFIDEVTEEVRRDRLVLFLRRYAVWISLGVILVVGTAGGWEWRKAQVRSAAEARGQQIYDALETADADARAALLAELEIPGDDGAAFLALHRAASLVAEDDVAGAVDLLRGIAGGGDVSAPLRDVARLKLVSLAGDQMPVQERLDILDQLTAEGHGLRGLALEQRAFVRLEQGDVPAAVEDLQTLSIAVGADRQAQARAAQFLQILAPDDGTGEDDTGAGSEDG